LDKDAKDLLEKLLVKDPKLRFGNGAIGSGNDIEALKSHPFFKGIKWGCLHLQSPPINLINYKHKTVNFHSFSPDFRKSGLSPLKNMQQDNLSDYGATSLRIDMISLNEPKKLLFQCKF
jgi:serine/threonine protein kinase